MQKITLITKPSAGYELLDSGGEEKLERYGGVVLARPDPQALWDKRLVQAEWASAHGTYIRKGEKGEWVGDLPKEWPIEFGGLKLLIKPTSFKHTGLFPEQLPNWEWLADLLAKAKEPQRSVSQADGPRSSEFSAENYATPAGLLLPQPKILNLFGYTGGATLAAAQAGAEVTHVDASKTAVAWARENATLSGLGEKPIRWIVEDVLVFVRREIKRGKRYDLILMDPPAFGHGPKDELWKIEEHLLELMHLCSELLSSNPLGILINGYAAGYSPLAFAYNLEPFVKKFGGGLHYGDLTIAQKDGRLLPAGIYARWTNRESSIASIRILVIPGA